MTYREDARPAGAAPPDAASAGLVVDNVVKQYATRGEPLEVLRGASLELRRAQNVAILGPSGSGKSTLLSVIGALEPPTSGYVRLNGVDPWTLPQRELAAFRSRQVGFVFQDHHLLPQCNVMENVLLPTLASPRTEAEVVERARLLIERVGLGQRHDHRPGELSGGERQRAALARALVQRPSLLVADEPTGNLDRSNAERMLELMLELQASEQMMLIVVTHSQTLAARMSRRLELDEGRLIDMTASTAPRCA